MEARTGLAGLVPDDVRVLEQRRLRIQVVAGMPAVDVCTHCADRPCVASCPHHALVVWPSGRVELVEPRCTGCGHCVAACGLHAVWRVGVLDKAVKCDGCRPLGRAPACVDACPTAALSPAVR